MATRETGNQRRPRAPRAHGTLDVFVRGGKWWARVPGRSPNRVTLGLSAQDVSREDAYRHAAREFGARALDARAAQAAQVDALTELAAAYMREHASRWAPRHADNVAYRLSRWVDAMAEAGVTRASHVTTGALAAWVEREKKRRRREGARAPETNPRAKPLPGKQRPRKRSSKQCPVPTEPAPRITAATINRTIQIVRAMARWAEAQQPPLTSAPALVAWKNLREIERKADPVIPSPEEWAAVVGHLANAPAPTWVKDETVAARARANHQGLALLVTLAVQTGLRIGELRHLRAEDVGDREVRVRAWGDWRPKDYEERDVPVPPSVAAAARAFVAWRAEARGLTLHAVKLTEAFLARYLDRAWEATGLEGAAPRMHDCRRTFATELSRRPGVSLRDVQRLLGHGDLETTRRYLARYRSDAVAPAIDMGLGRVLEGAGVVAVTTP